MRLFDRGMCPVKPRYMCALHVQGRGCPTDTHFMQNTERVARRDGEAGR